MMSRPLAPRAGRARLQRHQRGISLPVSLILLVVITLVALGSMRGVVLQSRMSGTTHDRSLAFQAAEAALRDAEARAATATPASFPANGCSGGYCAQPLPADTARWQDTAFAGWLSAPGALAPADAPVPETIVEDMGDAPNYAGCENEIPRSPNCMAQRFQITSRSTAADRATVVVQSQFALP